MNDIELLSDEYLEFNYKTEDIIGISNEIKKKIEEIKRKRQELSKLIEAKRQAMHKYFRNKSAAVINLKNKETVLIDGKELRKNYPDSMIFGLAELVIFNDKVELEICTLQYNAAVASLRSLQAELNGYQTILRYLDE